MCQQFFLKYFLDTPFGHACGVRVDGAAPRGFLRLTGPLAPRVVVAPFGRRLKKGGTAGAAGCVEGLHPTGKTTHYILCVAPLLQNVFAVHRFAQGAGRKVLRIDRPAAGGFLSLTAFQAEGCGIALRAMSINSALRIHLSVSYGMIGILLTGSLRSPPPIRLRRTSPGGQCY